MKNTLISHNHGDVKLLTIVIPTYNRGERLMNQLKSIFLQPEYKNTEIVILDNHSNYDIENGLKNNFTSEELSVIELIRNPFNIGIDGNLSNVFMFCKTKYMWLLSDDDETLSNSIETVLLNIENYKNVAAYKYSIKNFLPEEDKVIANITEFIEYYKSGVHTSGSMIFISNNIFNMELLAPFLQNAFTPFNFFMLIITALFTNTVEIKFCSESIVNYIPPNPGSEWDFISMLLRASTFDKFTMSILYKNNYAFKKKQLIELSALLIRDFSHRKLIYDLFRINSRWRRVYIYNKLFFDVLINDNGHHWIYFFIFHFFNLINIDYANLFKLKQKVRNILRRFKVKKI
jgi:hypothetical protein